MRQPAICHGPVGITRRNMLQIGAIGALNLSLPTMLMANDRQASPGPSASADACILVFLNGGPSHLDMWDMKPDAPQNIRGEFRPIATSIPGIQVCEHLPRLSQIMSRCTLVRSVHHDQVAHAPAVYTALTGLKNPRASGAKADDHPALGSVVGAVRPGGFRHLPYVLLPHLTTEGAGGPPQPGFLAGWLGKMHDPFLVLQDGRGKDELTMPALSLSSGMTPDRILRRAQLLNDLDQAKASTHAGQAHELSGLQARARELLTSPAAQRAFRLDQEPVRLRDRYGSNIYGQSILLARRLVEAGTRLVCISWAPDANATWDTHGSGFSTLKQRLLPPFDAGISSLLADLADRGLLERTLVVVMGEIGRSPRINAAAGRDHWEFCYTALLAGGGIKSGFAYGASDRRGGYPATNPVTATDLVATIYHALGIPPDLELRDRLNRPFPVVPGGTPVTALFV